MRIGNLAWKVFKLLLFWALTLAALAMLALVFWTQVKEWIYELIFRGCDTSQFIYYVSYYLKYPHLPVNAWDHFWFNGAPRTIDAAWLHHTLASLVAGAIGVYKTVKIYPIVFFGLGALFVYLLFYELSGSILLSLGMTISFVLGEGYYSALFSGGVVLSAISQMFLPAQLYFLVRFLKRGGYRHLLLGSLMSVLGLASHGFLMMFFGFIPAFFFVLFSNRETNSLISKKTIFNAFIFAIATLTVGAYVVWPFFYVALLYGGFTSMFWGKVLSDPNTLKEMLAFSDQGIFYGFILSLPIGLIFWRAKRKLDEAVRPVLAIFILYLLWMASYTFTGNPLFGSMFPSRIYWIWPLLLGCLACGFLAPLSEPQTGNKRTKTANLFGFNILKAAIFLIIIIPTLTHFGSPESFLDQIKRPKEWQTMDIVKENQERFAYLLETVDQNDTNFRLQTRNHDVDLRWFHISKIPLTEGYMHVRSKRGGIWQNWFYSTISYPNWERQNIPRDMAQQQALFFLDWFGVKYLEAKKSTDEWGLAPHFYENPPYVEEAKTFANGRAVLVISQDYTSPIITAVNVPIIGFVGSEEAYMNFVRDLAMLNLNTGYLVPVKLSKSISGLSEDKLDLVDGLVIYDFEKGNPLFYSQGWSNVLNFTQNGGKAWVETGGNSIEKQNPNLPVVFPITANKYGSLDKTWQPAGELTEKVDFSSLGPLDYKGDPWNLSYTAKEEVKPQAKILLTQKQNPIAVSQEVGQGKVLWTGINIWYRPEEFRHQKKGMNEANLIKTLWEGLFGKLPKKKTEAQVERSDPEHIQVKGENFSGVVFKENAWPGWQATIEANNQKKKLPILIAGPELMYVPVPKEMQNGEIKVSITYQGALFYWFCLFVSLASLLVVILYLIFPDFILKRFIRSPQKKRLEIKP